MPYHELDFGETGSWVYLQGKDPLMLQAAFRNNIEGLEFAISDDYHKQWLNGKNVRGCTPLRLAATAGHVEACKFLLDHGAEIDILDCRWQTPLAVAVKHNKPECSEFLLSRGAQPDGDPMSACTPLYGASFENNLASLKVLIKYGALLDRSSVIPGKYTTTPLYYSLQSSHKKCFRFLLLAGADPEYTCTKLRLMYKHVRGFQSLYFTCVERNCDIEYAEMLYNMGASLYHRDYKGRLCIDHEIKDRFDRDGTNPNPIKDYIKSLFKKPHSLQSACRIAVRRTMGRYNLPHIPKLPLPEKVIDYLMHTDTDPKPPPPPPEDDDTVWYYETIRPCPYIPVSEWPEEDKPENRIKKLEAEARESEEKAARDEKERNKNDGGDREEGAVGGEPKENEKHGSDDENREDENEERTKHEEGATSRKNEENEVNIGKSDSEKGDDKGNENNGQGDENCMENIRDEDGAKSGECNDDREEDNGGKSGEVTGQKGYNKVDVSKT